MNTKFRRAATRSLIMALALGLPASGLAAKKITPKKQVDKAAASTKPAASDPGYEQWLKKFGAYDRIVVADDDSAEAPGDAVLKRAEGHMLQGTPQQALAVIEAQAPFSDKALETHRLWLGGQAHRALGDAYMAVVWYSRAAELMDAKQIKARLAAEPGLDALWVDVWRRQFWSYVGNPSATRDALEITLRTLLTQAEVAWASENFWTISKQALATAAGETPDQAKPVGEKPGKDKPSKDGPLAIKPEDKQRVGQLLSAASLEDYPRAKSYAGEISEPALRDFWTGLLSFLESGKAPEAKSLSTLGFSKAAGFWNANLLAPFAMDRSPWFLGSSSPAWSRFKANLTQLSQTEAQEAVDKELKSLLLSEEMSRLLRSLKFILTVEDGDMEAAKALWDGLEKRKLPITLRLAGGLLFNEDIKGLLPQEIGAAAKLAPSMSALLAAGGTGTPLAGEAPFWTRIDVGKNSGVNKNWPLDRMLVLADWQARWTVAPGPELARRSAFLFPDTAYGYDCLLFLTQRAVENRSFQLAGAYLKRMESLSAGKMKQADRLGLKAKLERESGQDEAALATYHEITKLGVEMDPRVRLDMATFLQLKNDFDGGREQLQILWSQKDKLPRPLQAEVLFWLGEGEHSLRNYDAALDYYLKLAYQYANEPMWPTVAMYRSAMIYEIKGKYDAARKFLNAVINTAERKEEREAARNRLNALDAKAGKSPTKESGEPVYPF